MFLVLQMILNENFPHVYCSSFLTKDLLISSFLGQKGNLITKVFLSSKSQLGIMSSSSMFGVVWKSRMTASTNVVGKPDVFEFLSYSCHRLLVVCVLVNSFSKLDEIFCARWSSPLIAFLLYRLGTLDVQKTGIIRNGIT